MCPSLEFWSNICNALPAAPLSAAVNLTYDVINVICLPEVERSLQLC